MRTTPFKSIVVCCWTMLALAASIAPAQNATITFRVKVPASTPADAKVFLCGDAPALGAWKQDGGAEAKRDGKEGAYVAKVSLAKDRPVEFKLTRGSWETVEKNADGSEMPNRTLTPTRDARVEIEVAAWADQVKPPVADDGKQAAEATRPSVKSTRTGDIRHHPAFPSKALANERDLFVYLPPGYDDATNASRRYPVFYLHDGQNLFDAATSFAGEWNADETAERLIAHKEIEPIVIVGISNTKDRLAEYTPFADPKLGGGKGTAYADFLVSEVKPFIDRTYRTNPSGEVTGVGGSSLGGLISLHIARRFPLQFGKVAVISPALWWNDRAILQTTKTKESWLSGKRFWVDMGTQEGNVAGFSRSVDDAKALGAAMTEAGLVEKEDFVLRIVEGGKHNEPAWSARFAEVLRFLYPAR